MQPPTQPETAPAAPTLRPPGPLAFTLACVAIALLAIYAYSNTFHIPFYFDDGQGITDNKTIDILWPPWRALDAPKEINSGAVGRPLVNFSLAVNYQISEAFSETQNGLEPWSYHAVNLAIHIATAWLLMAVLWRTLRQPALTRRFGEAAFPLAFFIALVWAVHPLASETVTNAIQRNESMVSFFYLMVVYCFIRSVESKQSWAWHAGAVAACFLGVISKELMFSAPLMVLLYDRTFVAGSFWRALVKRWPAYLAMCTSWILLGYIVMQYNQRGGTVGFKLKMTPWHYAMKQCEAIITYFKLSFWPHPLILDYGEDVPSHLTEVLPQGLLLLTILGLTAWALWRKPVLGFAGAWVFIILAPSSSIMPLTTQTEAEHRMYLPLAAIMTLLILGVYKWAGPRIYVAAGVLIVALAATTHVRNHDYRTELAMWRDDVAKRPGNQRAHYNYGCALLTAGQYIDASSEFIMALQLDPTGEADLTTNSHTNLGACYADLGDTPNALIEYEAARARDTSDVQSNYNLGCVYRNMNDLDKALEYLRIASVNDPDYRDAQFTYGAALLQADRSGDALQPLLAALNLSPHDTQILACYGTALQKQGRLNNAIAIFQKGLTLDPKSLDLHERLASAYADDDQPERALAENAEAVRLGPQDSTALFDYGQRLYQYEKYAEAVEQFTQAIRFSIDYAEAENELGHALMQLKRTDEARDAYNRALKINPEFAAALLSLGQSYLADSQLVLAETHIRHAVNADPEFADAHKQLGLLLEEEKRFAEALPEFKEVLRIDPENEEASANLKTVQAELDKK